MMSVTHLAQHLVCKVASSKDTVVWAGPCQRYGDGLALGMFDFCFELSTRKHWVLVQLCHLTVHFIRYRMELASLLFLHPP